MILMIVLGIETSCDETAIALVNDKREILAHQVLSQFKQHKDYGGVVPEIAARCHIDSIRTLLDAVLSDAQLNLTEVDAIAVTAGPGLIGGVLVGSIFAKGLALALNKPIIAVNHLEGHALTVRLTDGIEFPFLLLLVSGGHCQILFANNIGDYQELGATIDDAVGEAFDKVAKMLGLGYPGGPIIEARAKQGDHKAFELPLPLYYEDNLNLSFSGLKTAVKRIVEANELTDKFINDISASFQYTVGKILAKKVAKAYASYADVTRSIVIAGGVAANKYLKAVIEEEVAKQGAVIVAPPLKLCTDNAAMIAWAGLERLRLGKLDNFNFVPRSRWPLSEVK